MPAGRRALVVATYRYADGGLSQLTAPEHDAEAFAEVLADSEIAGFDVTTLVNEPHHVVGEAVADFYAGCRRDDLSLLYFSGHGLKDDEGRLYLAMSNTRRDRLLFTGLSAAQLSEAMDGCPSRRKVLILDCCYSGAFPAGRTAKADEGVQTLERFQGKGRAVLTASDATQYAFEGDHLSGSGTSSVFTRHLVEAIRTGAADLDEDGDIALDELYSYVRERVVAEVPQQRPKKQEDVDGRILIARNVRWTLPAHLRHAIESPISAQRLGAVEGLAHLHRAGNHVVRATVAEQLAILAADDSRSVSAAAAAALERLGGPSAPATATGGVPAPRPPVSAPAPASVPAPAARPMTPPVPVTVPPPPVTDPRADAGRTSPDVSGSGDTPPPVAAGDAIGLVLALAVLSGLLLALSRLIPFEASYSATSDEFSESTIPWALFVALPLAAAVGLLAARHRLPRMLPVASGLLLGCALVVVEHALFWVFYFVDYRSSYVVGPGLWLLGGGAAVATAAAFVVLYRSPLAGRTTVRTDWRVACALLVVVCLGWFLAAGPDTDTGWAWLALHQGSALLCAAALPVTLLRLRSDQRIAALTAITLYGAWSAYFVVRELVDPQLGYEPSAWRIALVGVVVTVLACWAAQAGPARAEDAPSN